jgi:threonine/homoserine/homoserine lactone efflux protein
MSADTFLTLVLLAAASAFTPGPNNALVAASGANFGYRRSLPHVLGIAIGFPLMVFIVGFFLAELFRHSEILRAGLRWGGAAVLLWLAWKVASSGGLGGANGRPRPFTFLEAAAFQWINPKAWAMAIAITAQFVTAAAPLASALIVAGTFVAVGITSASTWALAGSGIRRIAHTPGRKRAVNIVMGLLLAGCVVLLFVG